MQEHLLAIEAMYVSLTILGSLGAAVLASKYLEKVRLKSKRGPIAWLHASVAGLIILLPFFMSVAILRLANDLVSTLAKIK